MVVTTDTCQLHFKNNSVEDVSMKHDDMRHAGSDGQRGVKVTHDDERHGSVGRTSVSYVSKNNSIEDVSTKHGDMCHAGSDGQRGCQCDT